jgi:hypothetical protein
MIVDLYISRITPAGVLSECYSKFDACEVSAYCEGQYFGCRESNGLPSTLYFDIEPVFDHMTVSSRAYTQSPAPMILNTPVTSQTVGKGIYRHYSFEIPSSLSVAYELEIVITADPTSNGFVRGYLTRHGHSQLAGDPSDASCLSRTPPPSTISLGSLCLPFAHQTSERANLTFLVCVGSTSLPAESTGPSPSVLKGW